MLAAFTAVAFGLALLVWSADRFVEGVAASARHFGMPPLLIGMVVIGFGTSAPEMVVSALAASQGNPGIALGNAYGSHITNIALILGLTVVPSPIAVHSQVVRRELPLLIIITMLPAWQIRDGEISRIDAVVLLGLFAVPIGWSTHQGMRKKSDALSSEMEQALDSRTMPLRRALLWRVVGLLLLIASSRILVWGARIRRQRPCHRPDHRCTGTSMPELASSIIAVRKGEQHDIALGNILGSNLFNTLAVVGIAGAIHPLRVGPEVFLRDVSVMAALTIALFVMSYGFRGPGRINRLEGAILLACYVGYNLYLVRTTFAQ